MVFLASQCQTLTHDLYEQVTAYLLVAAPFLLSYSLQVAMAGSVAAAQQEIRALQQALGSNARAIDLAQRAARRKRQRDADGGLGCMGRRVTIAVYVLSGCDAGLALKAAMLWSRVKDPGQDGYPTRSLVEDLFLSASELDFEQIWAPEGTVWARAADHATTFLAEAATYAWVQDCNKAGAAPLSMDVFSFWERNKCGRVVDGIPARRTVNKFVQRFRAKWNLRRRVLRPEVHRDPSTVQAKARALKKCGPVFGADFWAEKRVRVLYVSFKSWLESGLLFGSALMQLALVAPGAFILDIAVVLREREVCQEANAFFELR